MTGLLVFLLRASLPKPNHSLQKMEQWEIARPSGENMSPSRMLAASATVANLQTVRARPGSLCVRGRLTLIH